MVLWGRQLYCRPYRATGNPGDRDVAVSNLLSVHHCGLPASGAGVDYTAFARAAGGRRGSIFSARQPAPRALAEVHAGYRMEQQQQRVNNASGNHYGGRVFVALRAIYPVA